MLKKKKKRPLRPTPAHPYIHCILYGDPGSQKTTMLATFPTPLLILCFDAGGPRMIGKDAPLKRAFKDCEQKQFVTEEGMLALALQRAGRTVCQIEYYHDSEDGQEAIGFPAFRQRMSRFMNEGEAKRWETIAWDSLTAMTAQSLQEQRQLNPGNDQKFGGVRRGQMTDVLEAYLCRGSASIHKNLVLTCHIQEEKVVMMGENAGRKEGKVEYQDTLYRSLSAPGRLSRGKGLLSQFTECYRLYIDGTDAQGRPRVRCQTQPDGEWIATTNIDAPNGCAPTYEALWKNYEG